MKFALARYSVPILACWFLIAAYSPVWGVEAANITSVQVTPDLKQITITCDRPIGRHSAFVIRQPFRLVVDLESTGLGNIPRRISVARNPLSEIRIGYANSRARVVVDFGEHPVPPFKVYEQNNSLVVCLGIGVAISPASPARKPAVDLRRPVPQPKVTTVGPGARRADSSIVSVKRAGVMDDLVFVELTNRNDPKRTYRLAIDLDVSKLQVRKATISDSQGHLKRFDLAPGKSVAETSAQPIRTSGGPRRAAGPTAAHSVDHPKFRWGIQPGVSRRPTEANLHTYGPLRVETFQPQPIRPGKIDEDG